MSGTRDVGGRVRRVLVQFRDVVEGDVKTAVQRGSGFVGRQHGNV